MAASVQAWWQLSMASCQPAIRCKWHCAIARDWQCAFGWDSFPSSDGITGSIQDGSGLALRVAENAAQLAHVQRDDIAWQVTFCD